MSCTLLLRVLCLRKSAARSWRDYWLQKRELWRGAQRLQTGIIVIKYYLTPYFTECDAELSSFGACATDIIGNFRISEITSCAASIGPNHLSGLYQQLLSSAWRQSGVVPFSLSPWATHLRLLFCSPVECSRDSCRGDSGDCTRALMRHRNLLSMVDLGRSPAKCTAHRLPRVQGQFLHPGSSNLIA